MSGSCPNYTEYGTLTLPWTDNAGGQGNGGWNASLGQLSLTLYIGPPNGYNIAATFAGQSLNAIVGGPAWPPFASDGPVAHPTVDFSGSSG